MEDSILYNLWLKTDNAAAAFEKWKQEQFSNISVKRNKPVTPLPVHVDSRETWEVYSNKKDPYDTQEWRDHVADCDRRGVDY